MTGEPSDGRTRKDERSWKEGNTGGNHISCLWPHLKRFSVFPLSFFKYIFVFQWILCSSAASPASSSSSRLSTLSHSTFEKPRQPWWPWWPDDLKTWWPWRPWWSWWFQRISIWDLLLSGEIDVITFFFEETDSPLTEIWRIQDNNFRPKRSLIWKRRKWNCISVKLGRSV